MNPFGLALSSFLGGRKPTQGSWNVGPVNVPDFHISEDLGLNGGGQVQGINTTGGGYQTPPPQNTVKYGPITTSPKPQTTGGNGGGGVPPPQQDQSNNQNYFDILRANYANARSGIEGLNPQLEGSYNQAKGDIQNSINDAQTTANTQKDTLGLQFGDVLKNQIKTYGDLSKQTRNKFSSLNSLDSNAYANQQNKWDQKLFDDRGATERERTNSLKSVDDQFSSYQKQAQSQLGQLSLQYDAGKQAIAQSLAQNNIQEASALQSALDEITNRANSINDNMRNWATQAAMLKGQGIDVMGALKGINGDQYASNVSNQMAGLQSQFGKSLIPQILNQTQGMIKGNKKRPEDQYSALPGMMGINY